MVIEDRRAASNQEGPSASPEKTKRGSLWRELPVLVVIAFVIALLIKTFILQAFYIPSQSMESTLMVGDRVLVEKLSYRFGEPARGDVVVFEKDVARLNQPGTGEEDGSFTDDIVDAFKGLFGFPTGKSQDFIKRVIAVEGDRVEGKDGTVLVNGESIEEPYLDEGVVTADFAAQEIPDGMIFVMGDNRMNSDDSRSSGPVPVDTVIGRAFVLIWPPADFATL
ncbi:MAG: signal peptidase I [Actinomycetota bacterium]